MSRIGKLPIKVPESMSVDIKNGVVFFNKSGVERFYKLSSGVAISLDDGFLTLSSSGESCKKFVGLDRSNIYNIVFGLTDKFTTKLEVNGVGYKFIIKDFSIIFSLGYSHEIMYYLPTSVDAVFEKPNILLLSSIDKVLLGKVCADIILLRPPEPYKGKGIKKLGEEIFRKEGKKK
jgi:large subunit ribosomal protein L6